MNTKELIHNCINYDHAAWDIFITRYRKLITNSVRYKMAVLGVNFSKTESNDIVQQIFFEIWKKNELQKIRNISCLKNWLIIVSLNKTLNYCKEKTFRNSRKIIPLEIRSREDGAEKTLLNTLLTGEKFDSARILESKEARASLRCAISKLKSREQLALKFNIYHGKTQKNIAEIMNLPKGTVATLIKRAKKTLRNIFKERIIL